MVCKVSPSCEKRVPNRFNSSADLSCEITQAIDVIKLTNSHEFKINTSVYHMKRRFSWLLNLFKKSIFISFCIFAFIDITIINTTIAVI